MTACRPALAPPRLRPLTPRSQAVHFIRSRYHRSSYPCPCLRTPSTPAPRPTPRSQAVQFIRSKYRSSASKKLNHPGTSRCSDHHRHYHHHTAVCSCHGFPSISEQYDGLWIKRPAYPHGPLCQESCMQSTDPVLPALCATVLCREQTGGAVFGTGATLPCHHPSGSKASASTPAAAGRRVFTCQGGRGGTR